MGMARRVTREIVNEKNRITTHVSGRADDTMQYVTEFDMQSLTIRLHAPLPRDNVMSCLVVDAWRRRSFGGGSSRGPVAGRKLRAGVIGIRQPGPIVRVPRGCRLARR